MVALDVAYGQIDLRMREDPRVTVIERLNARELSPGRPALRAGSGTVDVSFISLTKVLPAVADCLAPGGEVLAMVKPQFELGRERVGRGVVRDAADRREAILTVAHTARELGLPVRGFASSGLPGPKGNLETFVWCGGRGGHRRPRLGPPRGAGLKAALITHSHPPATTDAVQLAAAAAVESGCHLLATPDEVSKHGAAAAGIETVKSLPRDVDLCIVLGGDGSILYALRHFARTGVPVFGVNFGTVGFLAAVEREDARTGIERALAGELEMIDLPGLELELGTRPRSASTTSASSAARRIGSRS